MRGHLWVFVVVKNNNNNNNTRIQMAGQWDPFGACVVGAKDTALFESGSPTIHLAPHLSDDPLDGEEYVHAIPNPNTVSAFEY